MSGSWTTGIDELALDPVPEIDDVRQLMWDEVGVVRTERGLAYAQARLRELHDPLSKSVPGRTAFEVASLSMIATIYPLPFLSMTFRNCCMPGNAMTCGLILSIMAIASLIDSFLMRYFVTRANILLPPNDFMILARAT